MEEDIFYKKTIAFSAWKHNFLFKTSQELFSSHDIDAGTQKLLRTVVEADYPGLRTILDLGCGYGPVGLILKALYAEARVDLVDKDALAVDYALQNARLNKLEGLEVYPSLGYDDLKRADYDLIVSNIPGKAGEPVIAYLLGEAVHFLSPRGIAAVVVVTPLEPLVSTILAAIPGVEILVKRDWADHSVFHYRFTTRPGITERPLSALERGIYNRNNLTFHFGRIDYPMDTAFGLPDFDSLGNENDLLFNTLKKFSPRDRAGALVYNPGQGHSAVMLWKLLQPSGITLVDRDLLALRYTRHNLVLNLYPAEQVRLVHQTGLNLEPASKLVLALISLREDEGPAANLNSLRQLESTLTPDARIIVTSGSTAITRLAENLKKHKILLVQSRERWRGQSLLVLTRR